MYTFESCDKDEVMSFFKEQKPDVYKFCQRTDPITLKTVFVLNWWKCQN